MRVEGLGFGVQRLEFRAFSEPGFKEVLVLRVDRALKFRV